MHHRWIINQLNDEQQKQKEDLLNQLKINPTLCKLLVQRGITTLEEAKQFFRPELSQLHDPFLMNDMDKAVKRLNRAMAEKENILVYGDYDVDGTTAVALVYKFLQQFYSNIGFYIPDRYEEGYGVSYKGIDYAADNGYSLVIVLDCGIKASDKVRYASSRGVDIIICDHHNPDDELPAAVAVLDAKRADNTYPYEHLSGCGVGFKFMQAFAKSNNISFDMLLPLLDLLAVSIASDIVPITGENRVLMYYGLKRLNSSPSTGLKAIMETCGIPPKNPNITTSDIVFKIGPRINASGRMSKGREAVELLTAKDEETAREKSEQIDRYNQDRKDLDKQTTEDAQAIIDKYHNLFEERDSIVVYDKGWSKGVIGIVASRLSEQHYKPSIVLTFSNGFATGSARSISGFDIYQAIDSCRDLLENFGGHTYAAGLTLREENVKSFAQRFDEYVKQNLSDEQKVPQIEVDAELRFAEINQTFFNILQRFAPFGPENSKPVFVTRGLVDSGRSRVVGKDGSHLRVELTEPESGCAMCGIAFGKSSFIEPIKKGIPIDICYSLEENDFRGNKSVQLMVRDIKVSDELRSTRGARN